jgi:hypothetical protein
MIIRLNESEGSDVELELIRNGDVKVRVGEAHVATGRWSKDRDTLELSVPGNTLIKGLMKETEEDISTEDVLVFRLE